MGEPKPLHVWNDPDHDGHNCADCSPESMWKCDESAHFPASPYGLLSEDQRAELDKSLREDRATRRRGNASARTIPLGAAEGAEK